MNEPPLAVISGRYRLGELLGSGATASVFTATDIGTQNTVALKVLHPHLTADPRACQSLLEAARVAMTVQHENVAAVICSGIDWTGAEPIAWIAMELAAGMSVAELVERDGPMGVDQALAMAEGVLNALEASHEVGLIHRDVSPANIMVSPRADGSLEVADVRLIDFGISVVGPGAQALVGTVVLGNPTYASPEHAAGMPTDGRGDLYQLGGSIYTALTGNPPFTRSTIAGVLAAHRAAPPPVPSVARPGLSRSIDRLTVRALLKHPEDRFQTAAAMRDAVRGARHSPEATGTATLRLAALTTVLNAPIARSQPVAPIRAARRRPRSRPRSPGRTGGAGAALLVGALVASAWLLAANSAVQPAPEPVTAESVAQSVAPSAAIMPSPGLATSNAVMPEIEGSALGDASAALGEAGLAVGTLTIEHSGLPGDTVLLAAVPAGTALARGTPIELTIASGSNLVPPVTLLSEAAAIEAIRAAGFVAVVNRTADAGAGRSSVVGSRPAAGAVGRLGDEVALSISTGAAAPAPGAAPSPSPVPMTAIPEPPSEMTPSASPEPTSIP